MRSSTIARRTAATLLAAAMSLVTTLASAGELLVMPYACEMRGGAPMLTPSRDQGYRVLGGREEREFTACSPANPDMCRRWRVHRFDIECGGKRTSWLSVSAAADARSSGRSWVADGRMRVQMPPRWNMQPDDPCLRRGRFAWRYGAISRHCANRPMAEVEMPAGFAPMLDLDAFFVAEEAPAPEAAAVAAPAPSPAPKPTRAEGPSPPRASEKPVKAPAAPPQPASKSAPAAAPPAPAPPPTSEPPTPAPVETATETAAASGTPAMPTIINAPGAASADTAPAKPEPQESQPPVLSAPEATAALADASVAQPATKDVATATETSPAAPAAEQRDGKPIAVTLVDGLAQSLSPAWLGIGGVTMLGLLALLFVARRGEAQPDFAHARDIAAVSLDGRPAARERTGRWLATTRSARVPAAAPQGAPPVPRFGDAIPQTRDEALQVLGMGVAPEVSDVAIKKIVDGLRLSWHPDHAGSAEDRALRELRMKQINAAWDIITGKRAG